MFGGFSRLVMDYYDIYYDILWLMTICDNFERRSGAARTLPSVGHKAVLRPGCFQGGAGVETPKQGRMTFCFFNVMTMMTMMTMMMMMISMADGVTKLGR